MRIAKYIANAGYCSRREAEKLINKKIVYINKKLCEGPNINVSIKDKITINDKIIKLSTKIRLWKLYKPSNVICTNNDPKKRKTIFDLFPRNIPRVISIGRLDFMSEGLILLTNNGDYSRKLELPDKGYERIYRVCIRGKIEKKYLEIINKGIEINKIIYKKIKIKIDKSDKNFTWLIVKLKEGVTEDNLPKGLVLSFISLDDKGTKKYHYEYLA